MFKLKLNLSKNTLFLTIYVFVIFIWTYLSKGNQEVFHFGSNLLSIGAYVLALYWILGTYRTIKEKQRYFWLLLAIGIFCVLLSKIYPLYFFLQNGFIPRSPIEENVRVVGYLFFFIGFIYQMKLVRNTLPMLQYMLNIVTVIVTVNTMSWFFIVNPMLENNPDSSHRVFFISSIYHVLNISLVFAAVWLLFAIKNRGSLYLVTVGFLIQVVGDFFYINQLHQLGVWLHMLWPLSALIMGYASNDARDNPWVPKSIKKVEYNQNVFSFISTAFLLIFTYFDQSKELLNGFYLTVLLLLLQQVLTAIGNKQTLAKLKQLAYASGEFQKKKQRTNRDSGYNEVDLLLENIDRLAHFDPLTELPNRNLFHKYIEQMLASAKERITNFSIFYIDIDRFKYVNDSLGHDGGDLLLKEVAKRFKMTVNEEVFVARIGGDEFAILVDNMDEEQLRQIATKILQSFETAFTIKGHKLCMSPSIGISTFPAHGRTMNDLLKNADAAMYKAKEEGKNGYQFFNEQLNESLTKSVLVEDRLRTAIEDGALSLHYQPQVDLETEKLIGLEALLRWNDRVLGSVSPVDFIPVAEETGLIEPIGHWVLKSACQQLKHWQQAGLTDVTVAVNVSIRQFQNPNFINNVVEVLQETELSPEYLKIEITESILQDIKKTQKVLEELQKIGIEIAIDDFGTGYSSLSYLKDLPVNCLKIDKSFIDELSVNPGGPIVKTIINMGLNMNISVIAEGIESTEHFAFLRKNKCFAGQGYLFSKPLPAIEMEKYFRENLLRVV
jgi:diguanylate cyclase (GGDEF)-like protein